MNPGRLDALGHRRAADLPLGHLGLDLPPAAVLALVWEQHGELQLLLTRRASTLRTQPGDIALPGGRCDPGETPFEAAPREASEEVGLDRTAYELKGRLDEAWSSGGTRVVPVVGWAPRPPTLQPSIDEVDEIVVVSVRELADPRNRSERATPAGDHVYRDAVITVGEVVVYGFTADVVLDLVAWLTGNDRRRVDERMADLAQFALDRGWT